MLTNTRQVYLEAAFQGHQPHCFRVSTAKVVAGNLFITPQLPSNCLSLLLDTFFLVNTSAGGGRGMVPNAAKLTIVLIYDMINSNELTISQGAKAVINWW